MIAFVFAHIFEMKVGFLWTGQSSREQKRLHVIGTCIEIRQNLLKEGTLQFTVEFTSRARTGCFRRFRVGRAASATFNSVIKTAKSNGRKSYWYLREMFEKLLNASTRDYYLSLIPCSALAANAILVEDSGSLPIFACFYCDTNIGTSPDQYSPFPHSKSTAAESLP